MSAEYLQSALRRVSGTTLDAQGAANAWAGTTGLDLLGALNAKAGNSGQAGAVLVTPTLTLATKATGGTFAAGTYFWVVTAVNAAGETTRSNEVTNTLVLNDQQPLSWTAVPGASSYKVYRGTAAGAEGTLVTTVATTSYTDTGTAGSAATPPASNTAAARPNAGLLGVLNQLAGTTGLDVNGAAGALV